MEIEEKQVALSLHFLQQFLRLLEGAVEGRHESPAREIHDPDGLGLERIEAISLARGALRIIGRADEEGLAVDELHDILLVPDVIAGSDDVCPAAVELIQGSAGEALAGGRILPIDNDHINLLFPAHFLHIFTERPAARAADDVPH